MTSQVVAGRAAAAVALRVLRGILGGLAKDGMVSLNDLDRAIRLIERGTVELDRAYARIQEQSEDNAKDSLLEIAKTEIQEEKETPKKGGQNRVGMRSDPVHRLLALPLEPMFSAKPPIFERKNLSAFFAASRHLIGPQFTAHDSECKAIIQSLLASKGADLGWEEIYADYRTIRLMRRIFGTLDSRLRDPQWAPVWAEMMAQPGSDGTIPTKDQITTVRSALLEFNRGLPAAA